MKVLTMGLTKREFGSFAVGAVCAWKAKSMLDTVDKEAAERLARLDKVIDLKKNVEAIREPAGYHDLGVTNNWLELRDKYPRLDLISQMIVLVECKNGVGSGIYLGDKRLLLCAHEVNQDNLRINSWPNLNEPQKGGQVKLVAMDTTLDIALASIEKTDFLSFYGLTSIDRTERRSIDPDQTVIAIGIFDTKLHAVEGTYKTFKNTVKTLDGEKTCKIISTVSPAVWGGMSGGGLFTPKGECLGMINGSNTSTLSCTPIWTAWDFVDTIDNKQITPATVPNCAINRRNFLFSANPK